MKRMWGAIAIVLASVSGCGGQTNLPVYEVRWNGFVGSEQISDPISAYVWGSSNPEERPEFKPKASLLIAPVNLQSPVQSYDFAVISYGCFPYFSQPEAKRLYRVGGGATLPRQRLGRNPREIPIEVEVKPIDPATQRKLLNEEKTMFDRCDVAR